MEFCNSPIEGMAIVVLTPPFQDERGAFSRLFCQKMLQPILGDESIAQISSSLTKEKRTVRGLHFQRAPHEEVKMVRCLRGRVWDVAVDVREDSLTRYSWHAEELSPENGKMMILGKGFAHGFQALEPNTELLYCMSAAHCPAAEGGVHPLDPYLNICWPLEVAHLSARDTKLPTIAHVSL